MSKEQMKRQTIPSSNVNQGINLTPQHNFSVIASHNMTEGFAKSNQNEHETEQKPFNLDLEKIAVVAPGTPPLPPIQAYSLNQPNHQDTPQIQTHFQTKLNSAKSGGFPLQRDFRKKIEPVMGADFSKVQIHADGNANQLSQSIQAKAFTTGHDIFFKQGTYDPNSRGGQELLTHELTHVVQQNGHSVQRHQDKEQVQMKPDLQLHQDEEQVQMKPDLQLHQDEEQVQMKPDLQLHQDEEQVQMKPDLQLHQDEEQVQMKPDLQLHQDEEQVQMKPDLQLHQDEEQVQMKPDLQLQSNLSCQCPNCNSANISIQRQEDRKIAPQNFLSRKLTDVINIQNKEDSNAHCPGCSCPNCGVKAQIQRQTEQNHVPGCTCPMCSGGKDVQAKFIQTKPLSATTPPNIKQTATPGVIQRHSSWEHQLLGDAEPTDLAKIGTWQDLINQTKKEGGFLGIGATRQTEEAQVNIEGVGTITKGNVMHIIAQELQRLNDWQKNPPQKGTSGEIDAKYQTVLVSVPGGKDKKTPPTPLIITYGELNTLADYYGNLDVMKSADPEARYQIVQSVRQETFFRLKDIYTQLQDSLTSAEKKDQNVKDAKKMMKGNALVNQKLGWKFEGAITPDYISGKAGQIELLTGVQSTGAQGDTNEYSATLARNACHFVPESWHAWSSYHQKARVAAKSAWDDSSEAKNKKLQIDGAKNFNSQNEFQNDTNMTLIEIESLTQNSQESANDALLNNGFGDHYLQDSYAGGHMINKTKIMQWFTQWLDTKKWNMDFASDENWRKVQAMAYQQPEIASLLQYDKTQVQGYDPNDQENKAQNPQAVEDIGGDDWLVRFKAAGLQVPTSLQTPGSPPRQLMEWWQTTSGLSKGKTKQTGENLLADSGLSFNNLKLALKSLIGDGIVYLDFSADKSGRKIFSGQKEFNTGASERSFKKWKFMLREQYVPQDMVKFLNATQASATGDDSQYQKMASAISYQDYMAFMNNAYVQKSTNALHDAFCKGGLTVYSGDGQQLFKVYGDDAMFSSESSAGVKHSGETAKMSRDAIRNIISTGNDQGITTQSILNRLPNKVVPPMPSGSGQAPALNLAEWHNPSFAGNLKSYCESEIFPNMGVLDKGAGLAASGGLSKFLTKDKAAVHGSDAF
jgi:hypothetical protein